MYNIEDQGWEMLDPMHALHVSVTPVILTTNGNQLQVLMKNNFDGPSKGEFVLPNSIMRDDQMVEESASDIMQGYELADLKLKQSSTFSFPRIDPRSRVMTVGLVCAVPGARVEWVSYRNDMALIDITMENGVALLSYGGVPVSAGHMHEEVIGAAVEKLREIAEVSLMPFAFLGQFFTIPELVEVHEAILGVELVIHWVRRKVMKRIYPGDMMIVGTGKKCSEGPGRPAELFWLAYVSPEEREREKTKARNKRNAAKLQRAELRRVEAEINARHAARKNSRKKRRRGR